MSQTPIELKGKNFTLSVVHLYESKPEVIIQALQEKIEQAPAFLKNAPVVINVAALAAENDWLSIQHAIISTGLHVVGVSGCKDETFKKVIIKAGLPLLNEGKSPYRVSETISFSPVIAKTKLITTPVRSGQQIYARDSDLIVLSSVSAGAEVIADGNIHIYGMMRGRVLAGVSGDVQSQIFCTHLAAELVSIAGRYWLGEKIQAAAHAGHAARLKLDLLANDLAIQPLD
ncbi:MAG: septum site-determining protein MinC [Candidatus Malihini olakiniferum]